MKKVLLLALFGLFVCGSALAQCGVNGCNNTARDYNTNRDHQSLVTKEIPKVKLDVYPNPSADFIRVDTEHAFNQILIFNVRGQLVRQFQYSRDGNYPIADLLAGQYYARFMDNRGEVLISKAIIKSPSEGAF